VNNAAPHVENIFITTRAAFMPLLADLKAISNVHLISMETQTMSETVLKTVEHSGNSKFALLMPDTYFTLENPMAQFKQSEYDLTLALWKIRQSQKGKLGQVKLVGDKIIDIVDKNPDCPYDFSWGALSFTRKFLECLNLEMPHVGYGIPAAIKSKMSTRGIIMQGEYYDCGTPSEYFDLIASSL
jgi:dTDP-glucose pyrophosphorylase